LGRRDGIGTMDTESSTPPPPMLRYHELSRPLRRESPCGG
jgi:hypothetical protein